MSKQSKSLGIFGALSIVIGCIIGSGIFMNVNQTLQVSPNSIGLLMIYWTCGGLIAIIGGLCYAELGCAFTESGGERTYIAKTLGSPLAVTFTYIYSFLIKGTAVAGVALSFGTYLVEIFLPGYVQVKSLQIMVAISAILIAFLLNATSKKIATSTQIIFTVLKLLALFCIIIAGIVVMAKGNAKDLSEPFKYNSFNPKKLGNALVNILWATDGWSVLSSVVGDMQNPKRHLPIVMLVGVLTVLVLYCLTILSYISVLGYSVVMKETAVAVAFSNEVFGSVDFLIPLFIVCSSFGALNGTLFTVPVISMVSSYAEEIPSIFSLVRREQRVPVVSLASLSIVGMICCGFDFEKLVLYCGFCTWTFYFVVMAALYYARYKKMGQPDQFRVFIFMPALVQIVALYVIYSIVVVEKLYIECIVIFIIIGLIFLLHVFRPSTFIPRIVVRAHDYFAGVLMDYFDLVKCTASDI